jgi:hypothetical protein
VIAVPTFIDSSLADPDDGNEDHHLDSVLARGTVAKLTPFD